MRYASSLLGSQEHRRLTLVQTFLRQQILLDDTEDADVLQHLIPAITFINAELEKGRGVLVHCQAGMSTRSATPPLDLFPNFSVLQAVARQLQPHTSCTRATSM